MKTKYHQVAKEKQTIRRTNQAKENDVKYTAGANCNFCQVEKHYMLHCRVERRDDFFLKHFCAFWTQIREMAVVVIAIECSEVRCVV